MKTTKIIDLRTCKEGDKLISCHGLEFTKKIILDTIL